jgi:uncharacterized protein YegP (UPF0339 family)
MNKMKKGKFEIFRDSKKEYRFRLISKNGRIIAQSEGYKSKAGVYGGIDSIKKIAPLANILEIK